MLGSWDKLLEFMGRTLLSQEHFSLKSQQANTNAENLCSFMVSNQHTIMKNMWSFNPWKLAKRVYFRNWPFDWKLMVNKLFFSSDHYFLSGQRHTNNHFLLVLLIKGFKFKDAERWDTFCFSPWPHSHFKLRRIFSRNFIS